MASIRVLSGHGRYTDPWHPFAEGSAAIREILEAVGHRVEVRDDDVSCLQELDALDLVVVNLGGNVEVELEHDDEWAAAQHEFGQWIRGGGRVLAVHTAANSFPDWPEWPALLGGQWVRGTSWHPKRCIATFGKAPGAEDYPVWTGLDVVTVYDEIIRLTNDPDLLNRLSQLTSYEDVFWLMASRPCNPVCPEER